MSMDGELSISITGFKTSILERGRPSVVSKGTESGSRFIIILVQAGLIAREGGGGVI